MPAPTVTRISQYVSPAAGFITYTNYYSDGHASTCTGMPNYAIGGYDWHGDCVPDAHLALDGVVHRQSRKEENHD